jgi:hypothetical protein
LVPIDDFEGRVGDDNIQDDKRIKTQKVDKEGVRNNVDDIQTNPNTDNLSQEDLHEKLDK